MINILRRLGEEPVLGVKQGESDHDVSQTPCSRRFFQGLFVRDITVFARIENSGHFRMPAVGLQGVLPVRVINLPTSLLIPSTEGTPSKIEGRNDLHELSFLSSKPLDFGLD